MTGETHRLFDAGLHRSRDPSAAARVAVIPARGGSKRLPRKNIREFLGKPAIAYPIAAARRSRLFDRIVVSTDCPAVASIALAFGAEVPFQRPSELAGDYCGTQEVFRHALTFLDAEQSVPITFACCIYPTAVLVKESHLVQAFEALAASPQNDYCFTVSEYYDRIERALRIDHDGMVAAIHPEHSSTRSQDLQPHYYDAGQFYWGTAAAIRGAVPLFTGRSLPFILHPYEFVDINTPGDWKLAEAIARGLDETIDESQSDATSGLVACRSGVRG